MLKATEQEKRLLKQSASTNRQVALAAQDKIAKALELPLRQGVQPGDIVTSIYEQVEAIGQTTVEYPLHYMSPGMESEFVAFTVPSFGYIPERHIQGDYVNIPVFYIAGSIDWDIRYARNANWDVVSDAAENLRMQFVKKTNDDGWHTILAAAFNRNIIVADSDAAAGEFSVRLVSLLKTVMRRNGGCNSSSVNRSILTDLYISVEAEADIRSWNVDMIDETTRREIFTNPDGTLSRIFSVNLHSLDEFGEGQEYQTYAVTTLGTTLPTAGNAKLEVAIGLDKSRRRSFVMPVGEEVTIYADDTKLRSLQRGLYGTKAHGFAVLDSRSVLFCAI